MGGLLEEAQGSRRRDDAKAKRQAEKSRRQKTELKFLVKNVTMGYIVVFEDYLRNNKKVFIQPAVSLVGGYRVRGPRR
jgi:hypothetical protein